MAKQGVQKRAFGFPLKQGNKGVDGDYIKTQNAYNIYPLERYLFGETAYAGRPCLSKLSGERVRISLKHWGLNP